MSSASNVTKVEYYEFLGVSRDCNDQELKTAYRRLAMQYHPDRNPLQKRKRNSRPPAKRTRYYRTRKSVLLTIATGTRAWAVQAHRASRVLPTPMWAIFSETSSARCSTWAAAVAMDAHSVAATFATTFR